MAALGDLIESGKRVLWVSSCGGHLAELKKIADLYPGSDARSLWVTFDTPQARSMLSGRRVQFIPAVGTRDGLGALRTLLTAKKILENGSFDYAVSTGAAVAVSFLPLASAMGIRALYVESLTRTHAPSLSGKLLSFFPAVDTYTQYQRWASDRWKYAGSVLDNWEASPRGHNIPVKRVVVSLGTIPTYRFDRAVDAVKEMLPAECSVTWQLGATSRLDLPGTTFTELPWVEMGNLIRESDAFVCHAGVGSVLQALDNGTIPLLAVRSAENGEHVDDHQSYFAQEILRRGLGRVLELPGGGRGELHDVAQLEPRMQAELLDAASPRPVTASVRPGQQTFWHRGPKSPKITVPQGSGHHARLGAWRTRTSTPPPAVRGADDRLKS